MEVQDIKEQIDIYCRYHLLDLPKSIEEYIVYAERFARIGVFTDEEIQCLKI